MWQTKYASALPINLGLGFDFRPCNEGDFLTGRPQSFLAGHMEIPIVTLYLADFTWSTDEL